MIAGGLGSIALTTGGLLGASAGFSWAAIAPSAQLFGRTLRHTNDCKSLALTFDDGPNPSVTPALLHLLDRYNIRATFFVIGKRAQDLPALTKEMAERGHAIENHTYTHAALTFLSPARIEDELRRCDDAIENATGKKPRWMRPPFGFRGPQLGGAVARWGGAGVVMWSIWARDWKAQPAEPVIRRLRGVAGGDIVLLHDGDHRVLQGDRRHTVDALEYWIPRWQDDGFRFVTLDEIGST